MEVVHQGVVADQSDSPRRASNPKAHALHRRSVVIFGAGDDKCGKLRPGQAGVGARCPFREADPFGRVRTLCPRRGVLEVRERVGGDVEEIVAESAGDAASQSGCPLRDLGLLVGIELVERLGAGQGEQRYGGIEHDGAVGEVHRSLVCAQAVTAAKPKNNSSAVGQSGPAPATARAGQTGFQNDAAKGRHSGDFSREISRPKNGQFCAFSRHF
jgi:hypothetical protein